MPSFCQKVNAVAHDMAFTFPDHDQMEKWCKYSVPWRRWRRRGFGFLFLLVGCVLMIVTHRGSVINDLSIFRRYLSRVAKARRHVLVIIEQNSFLDSWLTPGIKETERYAWVDLHVITDNLIKWRFRCNIWKIQRSYKGSCFALLWYQILLYESITNDRKQSQCWRTVIYSDTGVLENQSIVVKGKKMLQPPFKLRKLSVMQNLKLLN